MEVTAADICTICSKRMRFWQDWVATQRIEVSGCGPLVTRRAHFSCYRQQICDAIPTLTETELPTMLREQTTEHTETT